MIDLKFLGRGSAFNTKEGNTSAYFLRDNTLFLIDCGDSIFQKIKENNLINDSIKDVIVLITHFHYDHVGSLSSLIMYCYYCRKIKCKIFYPNKLELLLLLRNMGCIENEIYEYYNCSDLLHKYNLEIIGNKVNHVEEFDCFSYNLIDNEDKTSILYSGDRNNIEYPQEELEIYDRIYQDTCLADYDGNVHTSLRKLCEIIPNDKRNKIYCMHFDCDKAIVDAKELGFNIVEVEDI